MSNEPPVTLNGLPTLYDTAMKEWCTVSTNEANTRVNVTCRMDCRIRRLDFDHVEVRIGRSAFCGFRVVHAERSPTEADVWSLLLESGERLPTRGPPTLDQEIGL